MGKNAWEIRNEKLGKTVVEALKKRHFDAYYCAARQEAVERVLSLIPAGSSVSWGGSITIDEIGLKDALRKGNYRLIDRDAAKDPAEKVEFMRQGLLADTFLMSANAISEDGQLFIIDGVGNRLAALVYGPKQVIVIAGVNKIARSLEDAIVRARTIAAPYNANRFDITTPCTANGICGDCTSLSTICAQLLRTRICKPEGRIKVILVGETLGY